MSNPLDDKNSRLDEMAARARILPVVKISREEDILPVADALAAGGLTVLEITLRTAHGLTAIRRLRQERPQLLVGAGTVLDLAAFSAVQQAGAQFVVTPGSTLEFLRAGVASSVPLLPGVSSASEVMMGYALGYRRYKLFPAETVGGVGMLKALAGPFGEVRFCPTGGVSPGNLQAYWRQCNVMCVGGSWMLDSQWIKDGDWQKVTDACREALALLQ